MHGRGVADEGIVLVLPRHARDGDARDVIEGAARARERHRRRVRFLRRELGDGIDEDPCFAASAWWRAPAEDVGALALVRDVPDPRAAVFNDGVGTTPAGARTPDLRDGIQRLYRLDFVAVGARNQHGPSRVGGGEPGTRGVLGEPRDVPLGQRDARCERGDVGRGGGVTEYPNRDETSEHGDLHLS